MFFLRTLLIAALLGQAHAASGGTPHIGFVDTTPDGMVTLHTPAVLHADTVVQFTWGALPQHPCCARLRGADFVKTEPVDHVMGDVPVHTYRLTSPQAVYPRIRSMGLAVVNATLHKVGQGKTSRLQVRQGSQRYTLSACFGMEGLNLMLNQGKRLNQHLYYYFNYDVVPDCPM